ncbi:phosphoribosylamine--glycine ligase, partial [Bacillus sp. SS-TM]
LSFASCKLFALQATNNKVYKEIGKIESDGLFYRSDIGYRAIGHEMTKS